jgi:hypothetical protein
VVTVLNQIYEADSLTDSGPVAARIRH